LAKFFQNWPNFTQIGAEKTNHGSNFIQLGQYSTKIVAKIQLRGSTVFKRIIAKKNYCALIWKILKYSLDFEKFDENLLKNNTHSSD
jgi:hypothetical protein